MVKTIGNPLSWSVGALEEAGRGAGHLAGRLGEDVVRYPGLTSHPDYALAARQMQHGGTIVSFKAAADKAPKPPKPPKPESADPAA